MSNRLGSNPHGYPDTMISAESGRPMKRGLKRLTITVDGRAFHYNQPGWWCDLNDPSDREGQLVDDDNQVAKTAGSPDLFKKQKRGGAPLPKAPDVDLIILREARLDRLYAPLYREKKAAGSA